MIDMKEKGKLINYLYLIIQQQQHINIFYNLNRERNLQNKQTHFFLSHLQSIYQLYKSTM